MKFIELIKKYLMPLNMKIIHYVLMSNHYHLILHVGEAQSLKKGLQQLNQGYARYYKKKHGGEGYFWQGRYKSFLIQDGRYLLECGAYIELNPVKAGIVKEPGDYRWSSYHVYGKGKDADLSVSINPEYEELSENRAQRMKMYTEYLRGKQNERRKLDRYFKSGVYGSKDFTETMEKKGLVRVWSHSGRPKEKECGK
jgi:putative transposase